MFGSGPTLSLGSYDWSFANGWSTLGSQLESWKAGRACGTPGPRAAASPP